MWGGFVRSQNMHTLVESGCETAAWESGLNIEDPSTLNAELKACQRSNAVRLSQLFRHQPLVCQRGRGWISFYPFAELYKCAVCALSGVLIISESSELDTNELKYFFISRCLELNSHVSRSAAPSSSSLTLESRKDLLAYSRCICCVCPFKI